MIDDLDMDLDRTLDYITFVEERHRIWERRQAGEPGPWTDHQILQERKFTNVFRILDPGSQFLLSVISEQDDPDDVLAQCMLYRLTNHPDPWLAAKAEFGRFPVLVDMGPDLIMFWNEWRNPQRQVFNPAYIVFPGTVKGADKVTTIVNRVSSFFREQILLDTRPEHMFATLRSHSGVGDFVAMQVLTDFNYHPTLGTDWENHFIVAGPGARAGVKHLSNHPSEDVIRHFRDYFVVQDTVRLPLPNGSHRVPSLMDIQNTFCEFSKWVRYLNRKPVGSAYRPSHPGTQTEPNLPAHWWRTERNRT